METKTGGKRMTKPQVKTLDKLWSEGVRSLGRCEKCGTTTRLTAAHIVSRRHRATRWDLRNGVCLCYRCHIHWAHTEPLDFAEWLRETKGEALLFDLRKKSQDVTLAKSMDFEVVKASLGG